jgi:chaperonin GroEL
VSHTRLRLADDARQRVLAGATALANALRPTLGPRSKCVLVDRKWQAPLVCNDGVTIAREVRLEDPEESLGAKILREAATRTSDDVGDGTTTATLLAHAILQDGVRNVVAGASAVALKRGLEMGLAAASKALRELSQPCRSRAEREQIATVSAHNDAAIGAMIANAMDRVGPEGVVSLEESKGTETELDVVEGMQFDRGFQSPYFVTDPDKMEAVLERPLLLLFDGRIARLDQMVPLLERILKSGRSLLVIAEAIEGDALATLVLNKLRGTLACAAVKAPGFGDRKKEMMQDLAALTGGTFVADEIGIALDKIDLQHLGRAQKAIVARDTTTILGGEGTRATIDARCKELRAQLEACTSEYDKKKLEERLARLAGGIAVIRVGASSEAEMKNKKEAFEDAIRATKAAVQEGIVPGGGVALLRAIPFVLAAAGGSTGDERTGVSILARALEIPARQIATNSGFDDGVVIEHIRALSGSMGFDAAMGTYVDLVASGIVDPTKVVRVALQNAVSVAGTLLLTDATLTEIEDTKSASVGAREHPDEVA